MICYIIIHKWLCRYVKISAALLNSSVKRLIFMAILFQRSQQRGELLQFTWFRGDHLLRQLDSDTYLSTCLPTTWLGVRWHTSTRCALSQQIVTIRHPTTTVRFINNPSNPVKWLLFRCRYWHFFFFPGWMSPCGLRIPAKSTFVKFQFSSSLVPCRSSIMYNIWQFRALAGRDCCRYALQQVHLVDLMMLLLLFQ